MIGLADDIIEELARTAADDDERAALECVARAALEEVARYDACIDAASDIANALEQAYRAGHAGAQRYLQDVAGALLGVDRGVNLREPGKS
jgi:hypothetical protein